MSNGERESRYNAEAGPDRVSGRAAIFLLSLGVLLLEIAYTRIFSFALWYHFTYVALSVGLLGYRASRVVLSSAGWLSYLPSISYASDGYCSCATWTRRPPSSPS